MMPDKTSIREAGEIYYFHRLTKGEQDDPMTVIKDFCNSYALLYVRIEMWDFFQAVQFYTGPLMEGIYKFDTSSLHLSLLTLLEAFYLIMGVKSSG